jgi:hypothetical protein
MIRCQETAAKHRSTGTAPKKKILGCFGWATLIRLNIYPRRIMKLSASLLQDVL